MRYILIAMIVFACKTNDDHYIDEKFLIDKGYNYWKDFDVYAKAFSDTTVMIKVESNRITGKHIHVPFKDSVSLNDYFKRNSLIDFIEKDSAQYEYKYCLISKKLYKVRRFSNLVGFSQMDANYSLDAKL